MQYGNAEENSLCRKSWRQYHVWCAVLLAAFVGPVHVARAHGSGSQASSAGQLSIQVNDDRLTLAVAKVPQVYLYGVIDAGAPQRFEALMKSWKIPTGSDIYLNSPSGDLNAALALGRLFRAGSMVTHLGTPRRPLRSGAGLKTAVCVDACTYAYLGGLYRWAPTGTDRIGLPAQHAADPKVSVAGQTPQAPQTPQISGEVASYLKDMGVDPAVFTPELMATGGDVVWFSADQMMARGLANNGRLPLTATYQLSGGAPYLVLNQIHRGGERQITILCKPGSVTLTASDTVGMDRARQVVTRGTWSYFEINQQERMPQLRDGASAVDKSVTMSRSYPPAQLGYLLYSNSIGAWVSDRNSAFRSGFTFDLAPVRSTLKQYYTTCWRAAPWPTTR